MRFIVHVGPHKTGTTYIQNQLTAYRDILLDYGVCYPTDWTTEGIPWCHVDLVRELTESDFSAIAGKLDAIRSGNHPTVLISCEGLSTVDAAALTRFRQLVDAPIEIAFFLRRWPDLIASHAQEHVRQGGFSTLPEFCLEHLKRPLVSHILNYNIHIEKFADVFGKDALKIYSFDNMRETADVFTYFVKSALKLDLRPIEIEDFQHRSLSPEMIELVRILGLLAGKAPSGGVACKGNEIVNALRTLDAAPVAAKMAKYRREIEINEYAYPFEQIYSITYSQYRELVTPLNPGPPRDALFRRGTRALRYVSPEYLLDLDIQDDLRGLLARVVGEVTLLAWRDGRYEGPPEATLRPAASPARLLYGFGRNSARRDVFESGWSTPERDETWGTGTECSLVLPIPFDDQGCTFFMRFRPFIVPDRWPTQRVRVLANDVPVAEFRLEAEKATTMSAAIPAAALKGADRLRLVFQTPDAARASEFGLADNRVLSIALKQIVFGPLSDAAPSGAPAAGNAAGANQPGEPPAQDNAQPASPAPFAPLLTRFESLGENCEFGLVQRRCGIEPLGLLRFSSTPLSPLLQALRGRFAGMGQPDTIEIEVAASGREYMVFDRRYGFRYHAWVKLGEMAPEAIHAREVRRLPFLIRKLVEDLTEGEKIFIFHGMQPLAEREARELADAMRAYGPGTLLWVELADAAHPAGAVLPVAPGLLKGHMDRFAPGENAHDLSLDCWLTLCRTAEAMVRVPQAA